MYHDKEKFIILGIGINGCEAVNDMITREPDGVEFFAACDNENVLNSCKAAKKFLVNNIIQDDRQFFNDNFIEADIIFIVLGSGESNKNFALKIARSAKLNGILTLVIPVNAQEINNNDIQEFKNYSDSVILPLMNKYDASMIVKNIIDLIIKGGFINIDLADVKYILYNTGTAFYGSLCVSGHDKISTVNSKILKMCENIHGSRNILMNFITGANITLGELSDFAKIFESLISPDSLLIWGHSLDENMSDSITINFIIGMNDGGYKNYHELFNHERPGILKNLIINGLSDLQIVKMGSYKNLFASCIMYSTPELVKFFINNGHNPRELQENGVFPENIFDELINHHDERETLEILDIIFQAGINLSGNLIQPFFTRKASPEIYRSFIKYGWNVNSCTQSGMTILMFAVNKTSLEYVKILVNSGADVNLRDDEGRTPLMYIDYDNDNESTEKLRLLIEHGADLNKKNNEGKNAFIYAAKSIYYRPEIVKIFIDSGIDINYQGNNGRDALEIMNLQNNDSRKQEIFYREVLPLMIKSGADSKFYDNTSLYEYNKLCYEFRYINKSYNIYKIEYIRRLFYDAIINYDLDLLVRLLNSFMISDFIGDQSINFAFRINLFPESNNNEIKKNFDNGAKILKLLRENGFDIPVIAPDNRELTYIISKSNINLTSYTGERVPDNILDLLCCAYSPGAFEKIIASGVNIKSCKNILNVIVNNYADYYEPEKIIAILLDNGADYSGLVNTWIGHYLESGIYIKLDDITQIKIILQILSRPEVKNFLRQKFSQIEFKWDNDFGDSLCRFMLRKMWDDLEKLPGNINIKLILAACHGNMNFIDYALKNGADINYMNNQGFTPLIYAAVFNDSKVVRYLLQKGASLHNVLKIFLRCYYHGKDSNTLYELINAGANINEIYKGGVTPLMIAAKNCVHNNSKIILNLIDSGVDINAKRKNGESALSIACKFNNMDAVKILLNSGADKTNINIPENLDSRVINFCPMCGGIIRRY